MSNKKVFWTTMPGILTGIAGIITAIGGLLVILYQTGVIGVEQKSETKEDKTILESKSGQKTTEPGQQPTEPSQKPAEPEQKSDEAAKIIGKIYYNNKVITNYSNAYAIITRFYRTGSGEDVPVDFKYDNQSGELEIGNVPPGQYNLGIYVDAGYPFEQHSPGDYHGFLSGMNDKIVVPPQESIVKRNWEVVYEIHLLRPVDNQEKRVFTSDPPEELYRSYYAPSASVFEWEPVPGAKSYELHYLLMDGNTDKRIDYKIQSVTSTSYSPNLDITTGKKYYMFRIVAYNSKNEKIGYSHNFYKNGWGGWFNFRIIADPK